MAYYNRRAQAYVKPANKAIAEAHMGKKIETLPADCIVPILTNAGVPVSLKNAHLAVVQGLFANYAEYLKTNEALPCITLRGFTQWKKQGMAVKKGEKGTFMLVPRAKKDGSVYFTLVSFFALWQVEPMNLNVPGTEIALDSDDEGDASVAE